MRGEHCDVVGLQRAVLDLGEERVEVIALAPDKRPLVEGDYLLRAGCPLELCELDHRAPEHARVDLIVKRPPCDRAAVVVEDDLSLAVDIQRVEALQDAAQTLPNSDPRRAQVLALLASELHHSGETSRCRQLAAEATWSLVQGDIEASERWAIQAAEAGTATGQPDAMLTFGVQLTGVRLFQGRLGELAERSVQLAGGQDSLAGYRAAAALALIENGRADEARELALAENFQSVPCDWVWSITLSAWATVCSRLHLVDRAGELYELLAPFSSQLAVAGAYVWGSIPSVLGTLAATLECHEEAEVHFAAAAEIEESLGAPLFLARTHAAWARALIARGRPEDLERAQTMLEKAHDTATRLDAELITREIAECRAALAAVSS
jgi:hypothetical protein